MFHRHVDADQLQVSKWASRGQKEPRKTQVRGTESRVEDKAEETLRSASQVSSCAAAWCSPAMEA